VVESQQIIGIRKEQIVATILLHEEWLKACPIRASLPANAGIHCRNHPSS
jgi:hypothetical protein